jgi:hypothetical protein
VSSPGTSVLPAHATTGDGLLTALRLMARMVQTGKSLADLAGVVTVLPQVLQNVTVADKDAVAASAAVRLAVVAAEARLGDTGRVLLRPSGTEQLVRVMVEAPTIDEARVVADELMCGRRPPADRPHEFLRTASAARPRGAPSRRGVRPARRRPRSCGPPGCPVRHCARLAAAGALDPADLARSVALRGRPRPCRRARPLVAAVVARPASSPSWTRRSGRRGRAGGAESHALRSMTARDR